MTEKEIKKLLKERSQQAIRETEKTFGRYLHGIGMNILANEEDVQEVLNDVYTAIWNNIPPNDPESLKAYLARLVKNCSLDMLRKRNADKRGKGEYALALDELAECLRSPDSPEDEAESTLLKETIVRFLDTRKRDERVMFVKRYWYFYSISEIALQMKKSESNVKTTLMRLRNALKEKLEKEGFDI